MASHRARHRQRAALVAHHQPDHHHGQRSGHVQLPRQRVAAHDGSQRQQHLDLVVVHALQQAERHIAEHQAEQQAAARFLH